MKNLQTFSKIIALFPIASCAMAQSITWPVLEVPRTSVAPNMDATPGDSAWLKAKLIAELSLAKGSELTDIAQPTQVYLMWDERYLYVRFIAQDDEIYSPFIGRDQPHYQGDVVEIFLDAKGDGKQYIELEVSPNNQIFDQLFTLTAEPRSDENGKLLDEVLQRDFWSDLSWQLDGLKTATRRLEKDGRPTGWITDIALPAGTVLHRLGMEKFAPMTLRANLLRYDWRLSNKPAEPRRLNAQNWAPVLHGCPHISPQAMGFLKLIPAF